MQIHSAKANTISTTPSKKNKWSNFTNLHLTSPASDRDRDGDGFNDVVQTNRYSFFNKTTYNDPDLDPFSFSLGVRYWNEERVGGQTDFDKDLHLGTDVVYGQYIDIDQIDLYLKSKLSITDDLNLVFLNSGFVHNQESYYGLRRYNADHKTYKSDLYANLFYGENDNNLKGGISYRNSDLKELVDQVNDATYNDINSYQMPGAFVENTLKSDKFTLITGLRIDKFNQFGWKITPRLLARYQIGDFTDLRMSAGKGIRWSHVFSERANMLASTRQIILEETLAPEEAYTYGTNFIHQVFFKESILTVSLDAYFSIFQNQIFPDFDREVGKVFVSNFYGKSQAQSFQIENKLELGSNLEFKIAYNYQNIQRERNSENITLPFLNKHNFLGNASFETNNKLWQFDLTYTWVGSKRLPDTSNYPIEFRQAENSDPFSLVNFQLTKKWNSFEVYTGVENILDFRQEFPIVSYQNPFGPYFDTSFNWGPTKGREFYIGFRYKIQ